MRWAIVLLVSALLGQSAQSQTAPGTAAPKLASDVYKNLRELGDVPADKWFPTMSFIADSLGVTCDHCHAREFASDEKQAKVQARQMIAMTRALNEKYFSSATGAITCNTCHHGSLVPSATPEPDLDQWLSRSMAKHPLPAAADLIDRYRRSIGPTANLDAKAHTANFTVTTYPIDGSVDVATFQVVIRGTSRHVIRTHGAATTTFIQNADKAWMNDGGGWKAMARNQMGQIRSPLLALYPDDLSDASDAVTTSRVRVLDHDAYVVEAKAGQSRVWLYFDADSGLLVRRRSFLPSYFGDHTWQVEFAHYTRYGKTLLPDELRIINPAGSGLTIQTVTARKLDAKVDDRLFHEPN